PRSAGPDQWSLRDRLGVGNGELTGDRSRAPFAVWAMLAAPLMAGNDLRTMTDEVREILIAPEIVAIDQDSLGKQGRRIRRDGDTEIWIRELAAGHRAGGAFNRGCGHREARI